MMQPLVSCLAKSLLPRPLPAVPSGNCHPHLRDNRQAASKVGELGDSKEYSCS